MSMLSYAVRCEGLPDGPCPKNRHDRSVKNGTGDLMLCPDCDRTRHAQYLASLRPVETDICLGHTDPVQGACNGATVAPNNTDTTAITADVNSTASNTSNATSAAAGASGVTPSSPAVKDKRKVNNNKKVLQPTRVVMGSDNKGEQVIYSELLMYVIYHRDRSSHDLLKKVILSFFTPDEIGDAKRQLVSAFSTDLEGSNALTDRRKSVARRVHEAEFDDICTMVDILDVRNLLDRVNFAAIRWDRIPKYGPEDTNPGAVIERQMQLEATVASLAEAVNHNAAAAGSVADEGAPVQMSSFEALKVAITDIDMKFVDLSKNVTTQFAQLTAVCQQLSAAAAPPPRSSMDIHPTRTSAISVQPINDRSYNAVVFGLAESRDSLSWREELFKVLRHAAGHDVAVADALRLGGRHIPNKTRPVLVKFQSAWDRRLVLCGARNLAHLPDYCRVFIKADETVDERRRATIKRLHSRAIRENKVVQLLENGSELYVNNVLYYSVKDGFINANGYVSAAVQTPSPINGGQF